jgi:hypothetical protein
LTEVATALGLEAEAVLDVEPELLDLVSHVAHGPSRPGAPLTCFLVGLAVGRGAHAQAVIGQVDALTAPYSQG